MVGICYNCQMKTEKMKLLLKHLPVDESRLKNYKQNLFCEGKFQFGRL